MVYILIRFLNFFKLVLNLFFYKLIIKDKGSIIFIISNEDYFYIRFLFKNINFLMFIFYRKFRCEK